VLFFRVIISYVEIVPISVVPLRLNYFGVWLATMALSSFDPYHGLWRGDAPSKRIAVTTKSVAMICAAGLGVLTPQPANCYHYCTAFFRDFLN
jgi:TRAP-type uncharacterized transport system fused permease subunit